MSRTSTCRPSQRCANDASTCGEPPLRVYDTSGPSFGDTERDVREGLPPLRADWIAPRRAAGGCVTQMHYARRGEITPEMEFIAIREGLPATLVRD